MTDQDGWGSKLGIKILKLKKVFVYKLLYIFLVNFTCV